MNRSLSCCLSVLPFSGAASADAPVIVSNTVNGSPVEGCVTYAKNNGDICTAAQAAEKNSACKTIYHYTVTNTVTNTATTDYTGNIVVADSLLSYDNPLAELSQNKVLNFGLGATSDLNMVVTASLNLDYTDMTSQLSNNVPEPGSLAPFGIAVFGIAGARRGRRC